MMGNRKIIHLDLDAFFCSVEELHNPDLAAKPFAVGGSPDSRGVVASCSYAARKYGIHSAMPMAQALKKCPNLIVVSPKHRQYSNISSEVMKEVHNLTPLVEQISIDESFFDVSDLSDSGEQIARKLQSDIIQKYNLPCSLGVASNKLIAKIANNIGKASYSGDRPPNAITVVPPGREEEFLAPLPVNALWGIGQKTTEKLKDFNINTIGELSILTESEMTQIFGKHSTSILKRAKGIDNRPVITSHEMKSFSHERTFSIDINNPDELKRTIRQLSEMVGKRLRKNSKSGKTIKIKLRKSDFSTINRQTTLKVATNQDKIIYSSAIKLFDQIWIPGTPIRLIGVGVSGFEIPIRQLNFWNPSETDAHIRDKRLLDAVDILRERFGDNILIRASEIKETADYRNLNEN
jgi:DNA polymerase-4